MDLALLAQSRPQAVAGAVDKAFVAISNRHGEWGVDGVWSYDFNKFGYACSATSHSGAKPEPGNSATGSYEAPCDSHSSIAKQCDVLKSSFDRVLRSRGGSDSFRVLDLGAGSGGWLLQARRDLEKQSRKNSFSIQLHGVTGDSLPSGLRAMKPSRVRKTDTGRAVEVAHFQQVGIETFPLRLGSDIAAVQEHRARFAGTVETALAGGPGYDLIVSSWTFCHLVDPLATLEIWSNALAIQGELYVNDIDFSVWFDGESDALTSPLTQQEDVEDSTRRLPQGQFSASHDVQSVDNRAPVWESDPEKRMGNAFEALSAKGGEDQAFSIAFVYDDENYRTAIKVTRLSASPIRFAPVVNYSYMNAAPLLDSGGRPVYRVAGAEGHK